MASRSQACKPAPEAGVKSRILLSAAFLLVSCSRQDDKICEAPPEGKQSGYAGCIHRAAYQFARSPGPNTELARAVVAQCDGLILSAVVDIAAKHEMSSEDRDNFYESTRKSAAEDALRRIVQAKAGNCDTPK
ncbi:MAG: hypothetical protein V4574_06370 [Pseudomonadota bacterium]